MMGGGAGRRRGLRRGHAGDGHRLRVGGRDEVGRTGGLLAGLQLLSAGPCEEGGGGGAFETMNGGREGEVTPQALHRH